MTREELEKLKQTIVYFGHWYDVIGEERVSILEKSIKYIEELDKENGKLEGKLADLQSEYVELENFHNNEVKELREQNIKDCENFNKAMKEIKEQWNKEHYQLTKAKEIIRSLLKHTHGQNLNTQNDFDLYLGRIKDAEQFLKEVE